MNQSGGSPSDIKSPPLLSQTSTIGIKPTIPTNQAEQRPNSIYASSYRQQPVSSVSNGTGVATNDNSNKTVLKSDTVQSKELKENLRTQNGPKTLDSSKNPEKREYTEIERIEVPKLLSQRDDIRNKKSETSTDPPMKSGQSSDDEDESSDTTSSDSFSEGSESSNECAKIDFADEDGIDEEGNVIYHFQCQFNSHVVIELP